MDEQIRRAFERIAPSSRLSACRHSANPARTQDSAKPMGDHSRAYFVIPLIRLPFHEAIYYSAKARKRR